MVARVKKDSENLRDILRSLDKKSGLAGEAMLRAETTEEQFNLIGAGRRNFLYNGAMEIWQRGTSFNNIGGGGVRAYSADRWTATRYASGENDIGRETATNLDGFEYCLRSARGGGDTTTTARFVQQVLEHRDSVKLAGKFVTFSFYARLGSGFNGNRLNSMIRYHTEAGKEERMYYNNFMTATGQAGGEENHRDVGTDWKRYSNTFFIPHNAQQVGVAINTEQNLIAAVSADFFEITGCQLEIGRNPTPFEHRSYNEELQLCKRYYHKLNGGTSGVDKDQYAPITFWMESAGAMKGIYEYPVEMRDIPAVTVAGSWSIDGGTSGNPTVTLLNNHQNTAGNKSVRFEFLGSFDARDGGILSYATNGSTYIEFDADI